MATISVPPPSPTSELNIVAYFLDKEGPKSRTNGQIRAAAQSANWGYVESESIGGIINAIKVLLAPSPFPCLRTLEIFAHGSPLSCDGIDIASQLATPLRRLNLCDALEIYLSGCNTGLSDPSLRGTWDPAGNYHPFPSIAEQVANALPFVKGHFEHYITVYGARGYKTGSHVGGDVECHQFHAGQPSTTDYPMYPNAVNRSGSQAYAPFENPGR